VANSWETKKLSELCTVTRGASPRPILDWISGEGTPWVKISDATGEPGRYLSSTREFIKNEARSKSVVVYPGDLIVSNSATPGIPKFLKIEACIHDGWLLFRNFKEITPEYLYYRLLNDRKMLVGQGNGSVFTNLKTEILKNHEISLPPQNEQLWMATTLGQIDDLIAVNARIESGLEKVANALFRSWFVDFEPTKALALSEIPSGLEESVVGLFPSKFAESSIGEIPAGWDVKCADEIFDITIGRTPPRKEPEWFCAEPDGVPWVSIRDMGTFSTFTGPTSESLTSQAVEKFRVPIVRVGTVLMSFKLTVGKLCITDRPVVTNEAIAHFTLNTQKLLSSEYTYLWLANLDLGKLDSTSSIGTATNSGAIKKIKFLVPSNDLLKEFGRVVKPIFEQMKVIQAESSHLKLLRDHLLPRLVNGEIPVPQMDVVS